MTNEVLSAILGSMQPVIDANKFSKRGDGCYQNEKLAFKIWHNEDAKLLVLEVASINENGEIGEYTSESNWLFEEPDNIMDAESAGMDFADTLKNKLGVKRVRTGRSGEVALPSKKAGDARNIEALCAKLLAIFPQFKEDYKEHVAKYGRLLYINFFSNNFAPKVGEMLDQGNKKAIKKLLDMLADSYNLGDRASQNAVVGIILGGAVRGNRERYEKALSYLSDHPYLKIAFVNIMPKVDSDKKFNAIFS